MDKDNRERERERARGDYGAYDSIASGRPKVNHYMVGSIANGL